VRRVERGRTEPTALLPRLREQLHADSVVFGNARAASGIAESPSAVGAELRGTVAGVAAAVLGTGAEPLLNGQLLSDVPQFSSFRIVEIVERLEDELHFEFDADDLVPENLHDIDAICAIVRRSLHAEPAPAHLEEA
jgi:acyl carrier protein